jgi:hypothetical protein
MAIARPLRVGTRGSKLALAQTEWVVKALLTRHPDLRIETVIIRTKGDVIVDRPLREVTGKGFFVKEIEAALLAGEIDFAVHSLKDLPTELPEGLTIAALCNRAEPSDALVVRHRQGQADWQEVVASLPATTPASALPPCAVKPNSNMPSPIGSCANCGAMWTPDCGNWTKGNMTPSSSPLRDCCG